MKLYSNSYQCVWHAWECVSRQGRLKLASPRPCRDPFVEAAEEAEHVTFAQLLSRITESPETRSLADRALEVAAQEHKLLGALEAIKARVSKVQVEFSANRTFGAFVITNGPEVRAGL